MERHGFQAMGTTVTCLLEPGRETDVGEAFDQAEAEFERLEAMLSRFRPGSEVSRLNREGSLDASPEVVELVRLALAARAWTGGRFDPTVYDALVAAGYDRSFELLEPGDSGDARSPAPCGGNVLVDAARGRVELEPGTRLDLGGIGKGYAVDRVAERLARYGPCLVDAGGDLAVRGTPEAGTWPVGLETADGSLTLGLDRGAIATSGTDRRRWQHAGATHHHLIDPATGRPATSDLLRVTVVGSCAVDADVLAKVLLLAGTDQAVGEAEALELPCVLVTTGGHTILTGGLS